MPARRYLDATMIRGEPSDSRGGVAVLIPLGEDDDDAPAELVDPLVGMSGTWHRITSPDARPARYRLTE